MYFHPFEQAMAASTPIEVIEVAFLLMVDNLAYFVDCLFAITFRDDVKQPLLPMHLINE